MDSEGGGCRFSLPPRKPRVELPKTRTVVLENQTADPVAGRLYPAVKELLVVSGARGGSRKVVEQGSDVVIKLLFGKMPLAVVVREGLVEGEAEVT